MRWWILSLLLVVVVAAAVEEEGKEEEEEVIGEMARKIEEDEEENEEEGRKLKGDEEDEEEEEEGEEEEEEDGEEEEEEEEEEEDEKDEEEEEEVEVTRRFKRENRIRKVCPGRCVKAARRCKRGHRLRAAVCGEGVCCVAARRKSSTRKTKKTLRTNKDCASAKMCRKIEGTCVKKTTGCGHGLTTFTNSYGKKFCKISSCVCCAKEEHPPAGQCITKEKCSRKKGSCMKDKHACEGRIKAKKSLCSGTGCFCCLPPKPCKPKPHCLHKGGTCMNIAKNECKTELLVGKGYCKGKHCGCCIEKGGGSHGGGGGSHGGGAPTWGYTEENGPKTWAANFPICGGSRQSPVALNSKEAEGEFPFIPFTFENYRKIPKAATLINNGHTAMVELEQHEEPAVVGGDLHGKYKFLQLHFHWGKEKEGSEHTIDGRRFPGELHLVHYKEAYGSVDEAANFEDGIAVLGVMLELSYEDNLALKPIIDNLAKVHKADEETEIHPFALQNLLPKNTHDFFRYPGSLTTPTCNEIVVWTVFKDTIPISLHQLAKFRTLLDEEGNRLVENFRPLQHLNGREVEMGRMRPYWSYVPPFDPPHWPKYFPICGSKKRQSPVALVAKDAVGEFPRLTLGFKNYNLQPESQTLINSGESAQVLTTFANNAQASIQGGDLKGKYVVLQFHFHWGGVSHIGSEHTIDGKRFPAELHIVHYKAEYGSVSEAIKFSDGLAVLGVMLKLSHSDNPKLKPIIDKLSEVHEPKEEAELNSFPLYDLLPANTVDFFRYKGSLTTPTCDEVVIWTVFKDTIPISEKQLHEFRMLLTEAGSTLVNNFRPLQPLSGRKVEMLSLERHWSYRGATAPDKWASIYASCKGNRQSPIALVTSKTVSKTFAAFSFENYEKEPTEMTIVNNGHTAQVTLETSKPPMIIGGGLESYTFLQFHLHWGSTDTVGSEHTIDSKRFPAELHLVHYKTKYGSVDEAANHPDGIAVLGIMIEASHTDNSKFESLIKSLAKIQEAETEAEVEPFALHNLLPANTRDFFRYEGSLTTPACNEIVIWTVFKETVKLSKKQLEEFRKLEDESGLPLVDNYRPVQNLAGRTVYMS